MDEGLKPKDWNKAIDRYLTEKTLTADEWTLMNTDQKIIIQEIKKSYARTKNKQA